jgi:hypothetical protein
LYGILAYTIIPFTLSGTDFSQARRDGRGACALAARRASASSVRLTDTPRVCGSPKRQKGSDEWQVISDFGLSIFDWAIGGVSVFENSSSTN